MNEKLTVGQRVEVTERGAFFANKGTVTRVSPEGTHCLVRTDWHGEISVAVNDLKAAA